MYGRILAACVLAGLFLSGGVATATCVGGCQCATGGACGCADPSQCAPVGFYATQTVYATPGPVRTVIGPPLRIVGRVAVAPVRFVTRVVRARPLRHALQGHACGCQ